MTGQTAGALTFVGVFDRDVEHADLGTIRRGTVSYEYYWLDRWYNVFRFHEADGRFRNYYCNINMPPTFEGNVLDYVDLEIDLLVWPGGKVEVLDLDEFEENSLKFGYSPQLVRNAEVAVAELTAMIQRDEFPFNKYS
jgi:protein associated with RNAse G/E